MKKLLIVILLTVLSSSQCFSFDEVHSAIEKPSLSSMYERAIFFFTKKIPETFTQRLVNSQKYIATIEDIFDEQGVPLEIAYLPLIESGFSPFSVSRDGAVGLWQMVRGTARRYGLRIDRYVDERKDPVKSTYAAAVYLKDLHAMFGTWDTALLAYNAGEGKIRKFLNSGSSSKRLPPTTRKYLPYFMAALTIARDPDRYGFEAERAHELYSDMPFEEIRFEKRVSLMEIAQIHGITISEIKALNPALLRNETPPYPYTLRIPFR